MPTLTLSKLTKRFGASMAPAVNAIDMVVEDGSFTCILGPSGCGKSTLLRMIAGLEHASEGRIAIDGRPVDAPQEGVFVAPEKRGVGLVFQSYALWPHMTVADNIAFGLKLQDMSRADRAARVKEMVQKLRIDGLENRYPAQLSGGQQQRVALARTLALTPNVLLLDEPLSNLDASLRLQMRAELSRLHREFGTTIVFVTHDQWEAMTLATHIAVVDKGELQQMGTATEIYDEPANRFVAEFIGNPPINILPTDSDAARALIADLSETQPGVLALRPEAIELSTQERAGSFVAQVTDVIPTGGAWIVEMTVPESHVPILMTTHLRPKLSIGTTVFVSARSEGLHLFDAEGHCCPLPTYRTIQEEVRPTKASAPLHAHPSFT